MVNYEITKPVGLNTICDIVETNCAKAEVFKRSAIKPHHLIIHLDLGQGRSTLLEYIVDKYKENGVLDFSSGIDDYLEIDFDGTYNNFRKGVETIHDAAVYSNSFKDVIGFNASALASHRQETQWTEFNSLIKEISKSANLIFFVNYESTKYDEFVINAIKNNVENVDELFASPYTYDEYAYIIERNIENNGVVIKNLDEFHIAICNFVKVKNIATVKDAISLADEFIQYADFSTHIPTITADNIKSLLHSKNILRGIKL